MSNVETMARKNVHLPDDLVREVASIRFDGHYKSETEAIIEVLRCGIEAIKQTGRDCLVYLARSEATGLLKIGFSRDPYARLKSIEAQTGQRMEPLGFIIGGRAIEASTHIMWRAYHIEGEWFEDTQAIRDWFATHPERVEKPGRKKQERPINVGLNEAEAKTIQSAAQRAGLTPGDFIRLAALKVSRDG